MHNRRLNVDDKRGVGEPLNECNSQGVGISVPATYYVQLFNQQNQQALQRVIQQRLDAPAEQFFTFNPEIVDKNEVSNILNAGLGAILEANGFTSEMKLEMFTVARN